MNENQNTKFELTQKEQMAKEMLCLPLDMDDYNEIMKTIDELWDLVGWWKLNFAFTNYGPEIVEKIKKKGGKIFLDLKFHDIPNTVAGYARAATRMGVDMFNMHTCGGRAMIEAGVKAAKEEAEKDCRLPPKMISVTILTSIDKETMNNDLGISGEVPNTILRFANLAKDSGLDGVVCSAADLKDIKSKMPDDFMFVTPGVKGITTSAGTDQKRVFSPGNAVKAGSSMLVVGRAILGAENRRKSAYEILQDMAKEL